jgi:hypothetical protein
MQRDRCERGFTEIARLERVEFCASGTGCGHKIWGLYGAGAFLIESRGAYESTPLGEEKK